MTRARGFRWCTVAAWCVAPAVWGAVAPVAPAEDEVVELPPLEVIAPGKPLPPWQYVALGKIEVLSRCSSALTK